MASRLCFTTDLKGALKDAEIVFCAVGTPPNRDGSADLSYVFEVAHQVGQVLENQIVFVIKSTVPAGTSQRVKEIIAGEVKDRGLEIDFDMASNPEFLKEGNAVRDFMMPDRVVVGVESDHAREVLTRLYKPMLLNNFRVIFMDIASAEMTKYASNAVLATRVSLMNEIANLCERVGADINMVRKGVGSDSRIGGKFLYAGCGYGGSCFPKDIDALMDTAQKNGCTMKVLEAVSEVNHAQKMVLFDKFILRYGNGTGRRAAIWGLAFKPGTDDMREAPSLELIESLLGAGCEVVVYYPAAMNQARELFGERISYAANIYESVLEADAIFHVTEWKEFRMPNWEVIRRSMRPEPSLFDGRNVFSADQLAGMEYFRIG
jgi:UDPglucose 6-dehydrogenase